MTSPQSGLPGLRWRSRRNTKGDVVGVWVVSLDVPKTLQSRLPSRTGKPIKRLEVSTKTASLTQARKAYPQLMAGLQEKLQQARNESSAGSLVRALGQRFVQNNTPEHAAAATDQASAFAAQLTQVICQLAEAGASEQVQLQAVDLFRQSVTQQGNQALTSFLTDNKLSVATDAEALGLKRSATHLTDELIKAEDERQSLGLFATPSPAASRLTQAASSPYPVTLTDALNLKRHELKQRTLDNYLTLLGHWRDHTNSDLLSSITTTSLNSFARWLNKPKDQGGLGHSKDSANNNGAKIRSLVKIHNEHAISAEMLLPIPEWNPIRKSIQDLKLERLKARELAAEDDDIRRIYLHLLQSDPISARLLPLFRLAGLRNEEAALLTWDKVHDRYGMWVIDLLDSKTPNGIRVIPLNSTLQQLLLPHHTHDSSWVVDNFIPKRKEPRNAVGEILRDAKQLLNISGKTNAHSMRHAFGGDLGHYSTEFIKKKLMGHKGSLTDHYSRENLRQLAEAVELVGQDISWTSSDF